MKYHNKLVRDNIPQIIEAGGKKAHCSTLSKEAYLVQLDKKLSEEVAEYQMSKKLEELADLVEVIEAICIARGHSLEELTKVKEEKAKERGKFEQRIFLESVE